jgi:hypothetical protein
MQSGERQSRTLDKALPPDFASEHFSFSELTRTGTGLPNAPSVEAGANLVRLAESLLEPIRTLLGAPLIVHSGFRCEAVNRAVKGDPKSAHLEGRACDFHPGNAVDIKRAFEAILFSGLPYDKVLLEHKEGSWWIHIQVEKVGSKPRGLAYIATVTASGTVYTEVKR